MGLVLVWFSSSLSPFYFQYGSSIRVLSCSNMGVVWDWSCSCLGLILFTFFSPAHPILCSSIQHPASRRRHQGPEQMYEPHQTPPPPTPHHHTSSPAFASLSRLSEAWPSEASTLGRGACLRRRQPPAHRGRFRGINEAPCSLDQELVCTCIRINIDFFFKSQQNYSPPWIKKLYGPVNWPHPQ